MSLPSPCALETSAAAAAAVAGAGIQPTPAGRRLEIDQASLATWRASPKGLRRGFDDYALREWRSLPILEQARRFDVFCDVCRVAAEGPGMPPSLVEFVQPGTLAHVLETMELTAELAGLAPWEYDRVFSAAALLEGILDHVHRGNPSAAAAADEVLSRFRLLPRAPSRSDPASEPVKDPCAVIPGEDGCERNHTSPAGIVDADAERTRSRMASTGMRATIPDMSTALLVPAMRTCVRGPQKSFAPVGAELAAPTFVAGKLRGPARSEDIVLTSPASLLAYEQRDRGADPPEAVRPPPRRGSRPVAASLIRTRDPDILRHGQDRGSEGDAERPHNPDVFRTAGSTDPAVRIMNENTETPKTKRPPSGRNAACSALWKAVFAAVKAMAPPGARQPTIYNYLSPFGRFCSSRGIEPGDVTDEAVEAFLADLRRRGVKAAEEVARHAVQAWNTAGRRTVGNFQELAWVTPDRRVKNVPLRDLPAPFREDWARFVPAMWDVGADTIETRTNILLTCIRHLRADDPEFAPLSLAALATPAAATTILQLESGDRHDPEGLVTYQKLRTLEGFELVLRDIARYVHRDDPASLERIVAITEDKPRATRELPLDAVDRISPFLDDNGMFEKFLEKADDLVHESAEPFATLLVRMQVGILVKLVLHTTKMPSSFRNYAFTGARVGRGEHRRASLRDGDGPSARNIENALTDDIRRALNRYHHAVLDETDACPKWLFGCADGSQKGVLTVRHMIGEHGKRLLGVDLSSQDIRDLLVILAIMGGAEAEDIRRIFGYSDTGYLLERFDAFLSRGSPKDMAQALVRRPGGGPR